VQYKGSDLEAARGPGLGCFYSQVVALVALIVLTPLSVYAGAPTIVSGALLFATIALLLVAGQTIIFLLRLVAAERREGRRRPMATGAGRTATVGELEEGANGAEPAPAEPAPAEPATAAPTLAERATTEPTAAEPARDEQVAGDLGPQPPMRQ
jgi:hypothetical protein